MVKTKKMIFTYSYNDIVALPYVVYNQNKAPITHKYSMLPGHARSHFLFFFLLFVFAIHAGLPKSVNAQLTGPEVSDMAGLDTAVVEIMMEWELPGASLAVTQDGRLVYARGYGAADKDNEVMVEPDMRFRIASISKTVTAVAIMQLVEQGLISLEDSAFEILDWEPFDAMEVNEQIYDKTIAHLLAHRGGWGRDETGDPMFEPVEIARELGIDPPVDQYDIIRYMMDKPLDFEPGSQYSYSNVGTSILGRVIEQVTGMSYEEYIFGMFEGTGVHTIEVGRSLEPLDNEVRYYHHSGATASSVFTGEQVRPPYGGFYLEAFDAAAGLIASAPDLAKYASSLMPESGRPQLLQPETVDKMVDNYFADEVPASLQPGDETAAKKGPVPLSSSSMQRTPRIAEEDEVVDAYYALGWNVLHTAQGEEYWFHDGSLDGTSTLLVVAPNGITWALLYNSRPPFDQTGELTQDIFNGIQGTLAGIETYPEHDFFAPLQVSPEPGATFDGTEITFSWLESAGADGYTLQIAADSVFSDILKEEAVSGDTELILSLDSGNHYYWRVQSVHDGEVVEWSPGYSFSTGDADPTYAEAEKPLEFALEQNYPNPFNPTTVIRYRLGSESDVRLHVYDVLGRRVATLVDERLPAGEHQAIFDGSGLASGVYVYRLEAGSNLQSRSMVLLE